MLLCGEVHYFRVPKQLWKDRLLRLARSSANCVSTYIPWNWHMPREDIVDFADEYYEWFTPRYFSKNLREFLELAASLGLKVVARPGPYICSEWDGGGHPGWLLAKKCKLRSLDPCYAEYAKKWYEVVMPLIGFYAKKGVVSVLQVENEYFWGNEEYLKWLAREASKHVEGIPIVTNENWFVENIANTIDDYPAPWELKHFEEKVERYASSQPGLIKMFMELEGGWFSSARYGYLPTNRGSIPPEWTELLAKTAFMLGVDNINIYMFHGGSNPGYYTGKYITTTYDYEAPVREWGELSQRYYNLKRFYTFLSSFQELESTKPVKGLVEASSPCSDVVVRASDSLVAVLLRNSSDYPCYQRLVYKGRVLPEEVPIRVPPRYAKLVLLDAAISETPFKLEYSTAELLLKAVTGRGAVLVLYGDPGEEGVVVVSSAKAIAKILAHGFVSAKQLGEKRVGVRYTASHADSIAAVETIDGEKLVMLLTSRRRAERTWVLRDHAGKPLIVVSNVYFLGEHSCSNGLCHSSAELDSESCGELVLVADSAVKSLVVNGKEAPFREITKGVYAASLESSLCLLEKPAHILVKQVEVREDPVDYNYVEVQQLRSLEELGFTGVGVYSYSLVFEATSELLGKLVNHVLSIVGVFDYAVVLLNGTWIASGYHLVEGDAGFALRDGVNELKVLVESTGRPNDGLLNVLSGIVGGVYLGKRREIRLDQWWKVEYKPPYGKSFDMAEFLYNPVEVERVLTTARSAAEKKAARAVDSQGLYIAALELKDIEGYYVFDPGLPFYYNHYYRALLFVNNKYVAPITGPIDITSYLKPGYNEVAIYVEWGVLDPRILVYEYKVTGKWRVQEGTRGLAEKWYAEWGSGGSRKDLPLAITGKAGSVLWVRGFFELEDEPSPLNPIMLRVKSSGMRVLVFVNGSLVGRLYDDSPGRELYLHEPALRRGLNEVVLACIVTSNYATLESIEVYERYKHRRVELEFFF